MPVVSKTSSSTLLAVAYITGGTLLMVWTTMYYLFLFNHNQANEASAYWCAGFILTGLTVLVIGLLVGRIGQAAQAAEVAAPEASQPLAPVASGAPMHAGAAAQPVAPAMAPTAPVAQAR